MSSIEACKLSDVGTKIGGCMRSAATVTSSKSGWLANVRKSSVLTMPTILPSLTTGKTSCQELSAIWWMTTWAGVAISNEM